MLSNFIINGYKYKIDIEEIDRGRLKLRFPYNLTLIDEVKCFESARWHPESKYWSIANSLRNQFQLSYLRGENPYARYDQDLISYQSKRSLYEHQILGVQFLLTRRQCILAYDMGLGKTLIAIEVLEKLVEDKFLNKDQTNREIVWVGPKSALVAVQYEFRKWKTNLKPKFMTYESLKKYVQTIKNVNDIPKALILDEAQRVKRPMAQRSQAAKFLADMIRQQHGEQGIVALLTGTPAPRSPIDWWGLAEIACPGFLREGDVRKFEKRLGLIKMEESLAGGIYPKLVTWWDDSSKCATCGRMKDAFEHDSDFMTQEGYHLYKKSKNEVKFLYERLKGIVLIRFKKDVLKELPEIIYRIVEVKPSEEIKRAASMIMKTSRRAIEALTSLRELSDGFQYQTITSGEEKCPLCLGKKTIIHPTYIGPEEIPNHLRLDNQQNWVDEKIACTKCNGTGKIQKEERQITQVPCPKEQALKDLLDEYEDYGRVIVFAGFTGSVDRCVSIVDKHGWSWIRVDGRGWYSNLVHDGVRQSKPDDLLKIFQEDQQLFEKVAFVGQPSSGGIGLTLTASPVAIYYSNDFNLESRLQSMARIHRPGMDLNKGATVIDIIHLDTDLRVIDNLEKKIDLQNMTMGQFVEAMESSNPRYF